MKQEKQQRAKVSFPTDGNETTLGARISAAAKEVGARKSAAEVMGCSTDSLARYIRGDVEPPFSSICRLALASGKSLDWIASGVENKEGERLDEFEAYLDTIELPPSKEEIADNPELQRIQRELQDMRSTRAGVMKALIFSDKAAARQLTSNRLRAIEKHKKMNEEWKEATEAAGVPSDAIVSEHIKTLMFKHQIDAEEITPLLAALNPRQNKE